MKRTEQSIPESILDLRHKDNPKYKAAYQRQQLKLIQQKIQKLAKLILEHEFERKLIKGKYLFNLDISTAGSCFTFCISNSNTCEAIERISFYGLNFLFLYISMNRSQELIQELDKAHRLFIEYKALNDAD